MALIHWFKPIFAYSATCTMQILYYQHVICHVYNSSTVDTIAERLSARQLSLHRISPSVYMFVCVCVCPCHTLGMQPYMYECAMCAQYWQWHSAVKPTSHPHQPGAQFMQRTLRASTACIDDLGEDRAGHLAILLSLWGAKGEGERLEWYYM